MKVKIRIARKTVRYIGKIKTGLLRFSGVGGINEIFDLEQRFILNMDYIDLTANHFTILTPEAVSFGLFSSTLSTHEIELKE